MATQRSCIHDRWSGNGLDIANGVILTLDGSRQLTAVEGGGGSTDFIVDVTGYYL